VIPFAAICTPRVMAEGVSVQGSDGSAYAPFR
jgi:hypothetical protein